MESCCWWWRRRCHGHTLAALGISSLVSLTCVAPPTLLLAICVAGRGEARLGTRPADSPRYDSYLVTPKGPIRYFELIEGWEPSGWLGGDAGFAGKQGWIP